MALKTRIRIVEGYGCVRFYPEYRKNLFWRAMVCKTFQHGDNEYYVSSLGKAKEIVDLFLGRETEPRVTFLDYP